MGTVHIFRRHYVYLWSLWLHFSTFPWCSNPTSSPLKVLNQYNLSLTRITHIFPTTVDEAKPSNSNRFCDRFRNADWFSMHSVHISISMNQASGKIVSRCAKIQLTCECKNLFANLSQNTNSSHKCSQFCLFDELIDSVTWKFTQEQAENVSRNDVTILVCQYLKINLHWVCFYFKNFSL